MFCKHWYCAGAEYWIRVFSFHCKSVSTSSLSLFTENIVNGVDVTAFDPGKIYLLWLQSAVTNAIAKILVLYTTLHLYIYEFQIDPGIAVHRVIHIHLPNFFCSN